MKVVDNGLSAHAAITAVALKRPEIDCVTDRGIANPFVGGEDEKKSIACRAIECRLLYLYPACRMQDKSVGSLHRSSELIAERKERKGEVMRRRFRPSVRACLSVLVTALLLAGAAQSNAQDFIDLADIVAGGDGHGTGGGANGEREFSAIDIDTGAFLPMDQIVVGFNSDVDGVNPSPVDGSDLVDIVFYLTEQEMAINSSGATFTFAEGDPADESFGPILSNLTWEFEEGNTAIRAGGSEWTTALRTQHGAANVHSLSTFAGTPPEDCSPANFYIIRSPGRRP